MSARRAVRSARNKGWAVRAQRWAESPRGAIDFFSESLALKLTVLDALICMGSPVAGLFTVRGARFQFSKR